jgi:uncharacterized Zn-binding protein involved in type VI secretion
MIKRYHITLGATTTAGGTVTSASSLISLNGARIALDGDTVFCKACNSDGFIKLDGPRLNDSFNGRQVALSDDLCICKCNQPPRLVNTQTHKAQWIDADWQASRAGAATEAAATLNTAKSSTTAPDTMPLLLRDPDTQEPFKQRPYRLELTDKVIEGTTDQNGFTRPLTASERAAVVTWHVDGESAPA